MNAITYSPQEKKPEKELRGTGARILVVVPDRTAIAGGAPQKVMIDEAGNIPVLGAMINNIRPTMLFADPKTQLLLLNVSFGIGELEVKWKKVVSLLKWSFYQL